MKILATARPWALALAFVLVGSPGALAQTTDAQRIDRLEALVRTLTGQVEELTFRLQQLQQQLQVMQQDTDFRFQQLGAPNAPVATAPAPSPAPAAAPAPVPATPAATPAAPLTLNLGAPPADLGAVPATPPAALPGAGQPLDLGAVLGNDNAAPAATVAMTGDPMTDYNAGYQLVLNGDYADAEQTFRVFVATYPGNPLSADAQYWVAETLFSRELYREAVPEYLAAYNANPTSELAPAALYKLGLSYLALNEVAGACDSFSRILRDFPNASNALRQSVAAAQANARCG